MKTHQHAGIKRPHPIDRVHENQIALDAHNKLTGQNTKMNYLRVPVPEFKQQAKEFSIDQDNYIMIDLTKDINVEGVRIKFQRREGRNKKTIGLQIEK